jgi:hypothetical protein
MYNWSVLTRDRPNSVMYAIAVVHASGMCLSKDAKQSFVIGTFQLPGINDDLHLLAWQVQSCKVISASVRISLTLWLRSLWSPCMATAALISARLGKLKPWSSISSMRISAATLDVHP